MIFNLFKSRPRRKPALKLYAAISECSRSPQLYLSFGVPDTAEGRFESLSLHLSLILRRLKELPSPALDLSKELIDIFFHDLDGALRTLGVSDVSVAKKIKPLAQAFYGRAKAMEEALASADPQSLIDVLSRNVLGEENAPTGASLANYVQEAIKHITSKDINFITAAQNLFGEK
jgi:cytochrome b pre-mRNA-processing protein 3